LRRVLRLIKSSHADLASKNAKTASAARSRLRVALYYLAGYLDGKGLINPGLKPGFASIFGSKGAPSDPMETLDALEKDLEALLDPTRILGLGIGLIAVGVGLKVLGDWIGSLDD
jgi:hypothetical protein